MSSELPQGAASIELEQELSSEQIEQIMGKVQDIDSYGLGYHAINASALRRREFGNTTLKNVLKNGLFNLKVSEKLFCKYITDEKRYIHENRTRYAAGLSAPQGKNEHLNNLFFNIVGKSSRNNYYPGDTQIANDNFFLYWDAVGLVFSLDYLVDYSELSEDEKNECSSKKSPVNRVYNDNQLKPPVMSVVGYRGKIRIPPKSFSGIVFRIADKKDVVRDEKDEKEYIVKALDIAGSMREIYQQSNELLPIYDVHGNLWWPKQMSYKEVKKLISERNAKTPIEEDE